MANDMAASADKSRDINDRDISPDLPKYSCHMLYIYFMYGTGKISDMA